MRVRDVLGFVLGTGLAGGSLALTGSSGQEQIARSFATLSPPRAAPHPEPTPIGPEPCLTESTSVPRRLPATRTDLEHVLRTEPARLGSASLGAPTRGRLFGGTRLEPSEAIAIEGGYPWGTELTVRTVTRAIEHVYRCVPGTPKLHVGDISREGGGWLRPHRSHQSGLDADLGYYYEGGEAWYQRATAQTLDRRRTWALIRALVDSGNVEMIFIDRSVQLLLRDYVASEDPDGLALFPTKSRPGESVIRHAWGHATHMHVRFADKDSVELGAKLAPLLDTTKLGKRR
ncbi:MAG: penicillin-insensitive murein endopeptidase [Myxococcales bacterium]|nr:penicillin-insensitive murein endopeptidase [Myxococcales bacterium]